MKLVSDEREERSTSLSAADVTPDKSKVIQPLMSSENLGSRMGSVFRPAASLSQNLGSKTGSVFRSTASAPKNIRFPSSTVTRPATTPIASPVFAGFPRYEDSEDTKRRDFEESQARYEMEKEKVWTQGEESDHFVCNDSVYLRTTIFVHLGLRRLFLVLGEELPQFFGYLGSRFILRNW